MFYFSSVSLYQGFLMVGYATVYTMLPVFSLVLDMDVNGKIALTYPELYKELTKGRSLTYKTFFVWCLISLYQGKGSPTSSTYVKFKASNIFSGALTENYPKCLINLCGTVDAGAILCA